MADTLSDLQEDRALLRERWRKVVSGPASHSVGDRSYSEWDPYTIRKELDAVDRQIAQLTAPAAAGTTLGRLRRGR